MWTAPHVGLDLGQSKIILDYQRPEGFPINPIRHYSHSCRLVLFCFTRVHHVTRPSY